jgi:hypothetical protein
MDYPLIYEAFLPSLAAGLSIFSTLKAGFEADRISQEEAQKLRQEAFANAANRAKEVRKFHGMQKASFLKSGVLLEGTPLDILADTIEEGEQEVSNILEFGQTRANSVRRRGISEKERSIFSGISRGIRIFGKGQS